MLTKNKPYSLKSLNWTKDKRNKLPWHCFRTLNTLIEKQYKLNKDMILRIYSERSRFTIKLTASSMTGRFCQNSCHDSLRWGQSILTMSSFLKVLTPQVFSVCRKSLPRLLMSFLWKKLRAVKLFLCVWCFSKHYFTSHVKFDWLDIHKFRLACSVFCLWYTARDFKKVALIHDYWLSTSVYYVDKILKIFKTFFFLISFSNQW